MDQNASDQLPRGQVDFCFVETGAVSPEVGFEKFSGDLSEEERDACRRFVFEEDRHLYLLAHALLRHALSSYTGLPPGAWTFRRGPWGKPALAGPSAAALRFNLSHTRGLAACAVGWDGPIGVDVETLDSGGKRSVRDLARWSFAPAEIAWIEARPENEAEQAAVEIWTLKEAFLKAVGLGLHLPARQFAIVPEPDGPPVLVSCALEGEPPELWRFAQLRLRSRFAAAIAIRRARDQDLIIHAREWRPEGPGWRSMPLTCGTRHQWVL
jgi:4'-phosphopantetheinyl transferase